MVVFASYELVPYLYREPAAHYPVLLRKARTLVLKVSFSLTSFYFPFFFFLYWGLNSGPHA
jgi:hypothetical protein